MSRLLEPEPVETLDFKWGIKRGRGGKKKEIQFYESFTYDGVYYTLYDTVYLYKESEPEPYLGKLIKIWENHDKTKKVKVHWFFRPSEISNWIEEGMAFEKEIFLASGKGVGSANVNPLEAIAGKCNVLCTLKDERNPQPSAQELELADYFFYRTFDVERCTISELMSDKVAGLEVKFVFNRKENENNGGVISVKKGGDKPIPVDAVNSSDVAGSSFQKTLSRSKATGLNGDSENVDIKLPDVCLGEAEVDDRKVAKGSVPLESWLPGETVADCSETSGKNKNGKSVEALNIYGNDSKPLKRFSSFTDKKPSISQSKADVEEAVGVAKKSGVLESSLPSKSMADGSETSLENRTVKSMEILADSNDLKPLKRSSSCIDKELENGERKELVGLDNVVKAAKDTGTTEDRPLKKPMVNYPVTKSENKDSCQKLGATSDKKGGKDLVSSGGKRKLDDDFLGLDKGLKKQKTGEKMTKLSGGKLPKAFAGHSVRDKSSETVEFEVIPRPTDERSKWFRPTPWEERMKSSYEQGTLLQLANLDSGFTSSEVEDIIWHAFKEHCTAKMIQRTACSSPNSGQAYIIMKTKATADMIFKKLKDGCLMLPNGRPLVGSRPQPPNFPGKQSTCIGHLSILSVDKMKQLMQREMRDAVSTSHCSQPNTIEFEMALEWCLLQSRSDNWWKRLYKQQGEELRKLKANLKLKR